MINRETTIEEIDIAQQQFYQSITALLTLENYNNHKFHIPTTTPKLKMPKSQIRNGWTEEDWFESLVQKIYMRLNYENQFALDRVGGFKNINEKKLLWLILKAFASQIEQLVYNNCWTTVLEGGSISVGSSVIQSSEIIDDFWFAEPYAILKSVGLINEFAWTDIKDVPVDLSEFATKKYVNLQDDMVIEIATSYTNEKVRETIAYIDNEIVKVNQKFDQVCEDLNTKIDDITLDTIYQKTDEQGNNLGEPIPLGKTIDLVIAGISKPLYDPITRTLTLETIKEIPPVGVGQLTTTPISSANGGDKYGISASWAYNQQEALSVSSTSPNQPTLVQLMTNLYSVEFIDEAPMVESPPLATFSNDDVMQGDDPFVEEPRAFEGELADDPLRVFNAIREGQNVNSIITEMLEEQVRLKELFAPTKEYVDFQKAHSGKYLEENIENWKNKNKE